jgi:hypothetical protein
VQLFITKVNTKRKEAFMLTREQKEAVNAEFRKIIAEKGWSDTQNEAYDLHEQMMNDANDADLAAWEASGGSERARETAAMHRRQCFYA